MNKFIIKQFNQKMTKFLPVFMVFLCSCTSQKSAIKSESFATIYKNQYGTTENASYIHLTNNEDYIQFIETLHLEDFEFTNLTKVDFKENDIVVLHQGRKNTGGYQIDVASISWENDTLLIQKLETLPKNGEPVTMALTAPYCITVIPKAKNIRIIE